MDYIRIVNWEDFQHYKKRNPPWIKLHTQLLDNDKFECLQNDSKLLLLCLWLFNARKGDGQVKADEKYLARKLPVTGKVKLQPLIDAGFITVAQDDSIVQATDDSKVLVSDRGEIETEREGETEKETEKNNIFSQKSLFETARKEYPGTKRGLDEEWDYLDTVCRKYKLNREQTVPKIVAGVNRLLVWRNNAAAAKGFVPPPKNFNTWLYNRCWTVEFPEIPHEKTSAEKMREYDEKVEQYER